ncbi:olfactory receptor 4K15-like [Elephas maximus indicus]|uniref:olfactory receptor 4K15-like n=1 Tax=Elephas maximus indicus TaxID=99487 RepID=UPI002116F1DD|nr:olfactory receptor 4K15-like [Elephas maximus indicus]
MIFFPFHFTGNFQIRSQKLEIMDQANNSRATEFVLHSLSGPQELQLFYFAFFTLFYSSIVLGNLLIVLTVLSEPALHTPMYFLLSNLSFIDVCLSTFATPKMIVDFFKEHKTISFEVCMAQVFFQHVCAGGEMMLLVAMAYDRYVAICRPLHYAAIMSVCKCTVLVVGSWLIGVLHSVSQLVFTVNLPFCGPNQVDSFFCDLLLVIKLACTDTYILEKLTLLDSGLIALSSFVLLLISYMVILITVRRRLSVGMAKAQTTLTAHVIVVTLFYGPCIFIYACSFNKFLVNNILSIFYTVFTPLLNPLVYTLRNQEVVSAMQKLWRRQVNS